MTDNDRDELLLRMSANVESLAEKYNRLHETVFNEGHNGLVHDMTRMKTMIENLAANAKEHHATFFDSIKKMDTRLTVLETQKKGIFLIITTAASLLAAVAGIISAVK